MEDLKGYIKATGLFIIGALTGATTTNFTMPEGIAVNQEIALESRVSQENETKLGQVLESEFCSKVTDAFQTSSCDFNLFRAKPVCFTWEPGTPDTFVLRTGALIPGSWVPKN